jgi:hypothetical protein
MERARGGIEDALGASLTKRYVSLLTVSINKLIKADLAYLSADTAYAAIVARIHG